MKFIVSLFLFLFYKLIYFRFYKFIFLILFFCLKFHNTNFIKILFSKKRNILALNSKRYRGELQEIPKFKDFNLISFDEKYQSLIRKYFLSSNAVEQYLNPSSKKLDSEMKTLDCFMFRILILFNKIIKINSVIIINYRYIDDYIWVKNFNSMNINIIMMYRECLIANERVKYEVLKRHELFHKYPVDYIIVHNNIASELFLKSKMISKNRIFSIGPLKMTDYLKKIKKIKSRTNNSKLIVFFMNDENISLFGKKEQKINENYKYSYVYDIWNDKKEYFSQIYEIVIKFAIKNPDVDVVFKAKDYKYNKKNILEKLLIKYRKNYRLKNIKITTKGNVQNLIIKSRLVTGGLQSSTLLESLIANKPVLLPIFKSFKSTPLYQDLFFKNDLHLFNIANSPHQFEKKLNNLFYDSKLHDVTVDRYNEKKKLFEKYFSSTEPSMHKDYENLFKKIV